jgi:hypothetical protein
MKIAAWKYLASFMAEEMLNISIRRTPELDRVGSPFAHFAKGWGIARSATVFGILAASGAIHGQGNGCNASIVTQRQETAYPQIARAAHMTGDVILDVRFRIDGTVDQAVVLSGPPLLRDGAVSYLKTWRVNEAAGSRECPIVISYRIDEGTPPSDCKVSPTVVDSSNMQHVSVVGGGLWTCDPSATITRTRHQFLFFHWYSKSA